MNYQTDGARRQCALAESHMEDTLPYITALIRHNKRAIRGLCQDILLILLTPTPSLSLFFVIVLSLCLHCDDINLTMLADPLTNPVRQRNYNRHVFLVICCCLCCLLQRLPYLDCEVSCLQIRKPN